MRRIPLSHLLFLAVLLIAIDSRAAGAQTTAPRRLVGSSVTFVPYDLGARLHDKPVSVHLVEVTIAPARMVSISRNSAVIMNTPQGIQNGRYLVRYTFSRLNGTNPAVAIRNHSHPDSVVAVRLPVSLRVHVDPSLRG